MDFRPEHYHRAALERMAQARVLYNDGTSYALAMYAAGVAVECMLRAFKARRDPVFDERHDLLRLVKASGMLEADPDRLEARGVSRQDATRRARELQAAVLDVAILWANDYRYSSEDRMRAHLRALKLHRGAKGDTLKANAHRLINAALTFITLGDRLWASSARKSRGS